MSTSTVPAALAALTQLVTTALPDRQVIKGAPLNNLKQQYVLIGWNDQGPGVTVGQRPADAGGRSSYEVYDITSAVVAWTGSDNPDTVLNQVYGDLNLIDTALINNPSLSDTCMYAQLTTSAYTSERGNNRVQAWLQFVINVQASRV